MPGLTPGTSLDSLVLLQPTIHVKNMGTIDATSTGAFGSGWYVTGGYPDNGGVPDTSTAGGVALNGPSVPGQLALPTPPTGNSSYVARLTASLASGNMSQGVLLLCDRLWHCGANSAGGALSATATTAQTITSTAWPARDINGSANGVGVFIGVEVTTALGTAAGVITVNYTNSSGTSGRSANTTATAMATKVRNFYPVSLQAGDVGVRSIQTVTLSITQTSGQWVLVAYRPLLVMDLSEAGGISGCVDPYTSGYPTLASNAVPFMLMSSAASGGTALLNSTIIFGQG